MATTFLIGLGSNLTSMCHGKPADTLRWAVDQLVSLSGIEFAEMSSWFRSAPIPASAQPDFINGAIKLAGRVAPSWLLEQMHQLEAQAGRVRGEVNAARVLDLDLLAADDMVCVGPGLVLPHPRLAGRAFVLHPLCDIAPEWRHPVLGRTAAELRDELPPQPIERLPDTTEDLLLRARALT